MHDLSLGYLELLGDFLIFLIVFLMLFPSAMYKKSKLCVILFKGLCLLFLQNVPGVTFIQAATSIPDSRVKLRHMPAIQNFRGW